MSDPLSGVFGREYADVLVPVVVRLDTVLPEAVDWLWSGRVPRGKLTLLIGDPGLGKSFLLLDLMARVSRAAPWPDAGTASPGDSVLLTAEDGLADTIRPRLEALEADCRRIHALTGIREAGQERAVSLAHDLAQLEVVIERTGACLIGVDPLSAYLGDRDSYKDPDIRRVLGPVATLAERTSTAIVGIMHLTKDQQRRALYRALGSIAFVAAARVVLAVGKDPEDDSRRLMVTVKNNLTAHAPALAFTVTRGVLDWFAAPVLGVDADQVLSPVAGDDRHERLDADAFLRDTLATGAMASRAILQDAEANGISRRTLFRAKARLGVLARREGEPGRHGGGTWYWSLPAAEPTPAPPPLECQPYTPRDDTLDTLNRSAHPIDVPSKSYLRQSMPTEGFPAP
jgi:putative DNA primase/helicase